MERSAHPRTALRPRNDGQGARLCAHPRCGWSPTYKFEGNNMLCEMHDSMLARAASRPTPLFVGEHDPATDRAIARLREQTAAVMPVTR